tara:strand:+ start:483 stop:1133 length:651 start_codon:yes stop_codon:yes gene_type:complete
MARRNPNSPVNNGRIVLTEDQQQAIANLKSERAVYEEQLKQARRKRNKIKDIIDNFESVILGDVLLDILPDETSDEIVNSVIISKTDITSALNGIDTSEIMETEIIQEFVSYGAFGTGNMQDVTIEVGTGVTVSGYTSDEITKVKNVLDNIFDTNAVKELISLSPILNDGELYAPVYYQKINESNGTSSGKELLESIVRDIEIKSTEPPVSVSASK